MKIALLNPPVEFFTASTGGAISTVNHQVGLQLQGRGHQVTVLSALDDQPTLSGLPVRRLSYRGDQTVWPLRKLVGAHRRLNHYDYQHYGAYLFAIHLQLNWLRTCDVVVCHNDLRLPKYLRAWLPRRTAVVSYVHNDLNTRAHIARLFAPVDGVIAVSNYIATRLGERFGVPRNHVTVALNGVDAAQFHPPREMPSITQDVQVMCCGRPLWDKGFDIAADAVATLREEGLPVSLLVVGSLWWWGDRDGHDEYLTNLRARLEHSGGRWLPHQPRARTAELFAASDIVCVLSRFPDPAPLVVLEAMAAGCAVVGSTRGGIPEMAGGAAMLVDPDDFAVVTDNLRALVTDRALLAQQQSVGLRRARAQGWANTAGAVEAALVKAVEYRRA